MLSLSLARLVCPCISLGVPPQGVARGGLLEDGFSRAPLALESEQVLAESLRVLPNGGPQPGSLAAFLSHGATRGERQNLTDLVRAVEDFERTRGLTPARRLPEPDGCVTVKLGPSLRVEMRFRLATEF